MKKPLVSIIMNCHNGEKYLQKSLVSIIKQTFKDWELIFWNNSSSDKSKRIFESFKDKRFKYFENKNLKKLYDVRNLAIQKASGKFLSFLDTDDFWKKNKLEEQIKYIKSNNAKCLFSNFYQLDNKKRKIFYNKLLPSGKITNQLLKDYSIGILTVLIERKLLLKYKFNPKYNIIGDFDFFIRLSSKIEIHSIQQPLAFYRIHSGNYSKLKLQMYYNEISDWLKKNRKWLLNYRISALNLYFFKYKLLIKIISKFLLKIFYKI